MQTHRPSECMLCGCSEVTQDGYPMICGGRIVTFRCGTLWTVEDGCGKWLQDKIGCKGHVGELYRRIRRALEKLKTAERRAIDRQEPVELYDINHVMVILEGESDGKTD